MTFHWWHVAIMLFVLFVAFQVIRGRRSRARNGRRDETP